jgi:hypothetical protein
MIIVVRAPDFLGRPWIDKMGPIFALLPDISGVAYQKNLGLCAVAALRLAIGLNAALG